ncbi:RagB/SusD domain-containing protein [Epilithonimonas mollis]|uniref:RagB/SusD domain-containing protein n=2 Tax=Epilithonimonas mollis TaxID=216903 RepID=A0A1M6URA4_9FLAO|nr:RagB/SusD domain-containing protein [Epilithonimonas mollis]
MMLKKIFLLISVSVITSCSDFLNVDLPKDQLTKDLVFNDDNLARSAMAGVYRSLETGGFLFGGASGGGVYLGCYSDELVAYNTTSSEYQLYNMDVNARSSMVKNLWQTSFNQIYSINSIIDGLENSAGVSAAVKKQLRGEALFLRALLHLYLAGTYDRIPYVTSISYELNQSISSQPIDAVLSAARKDVEEALSLLPDNAARGLRIRPTKAAAYALLARVALYQKDWQNAVLYSSKIIADPAYTLEPDVKTVFLKEGRSVIWAFEPPVALGNTREAITYILLGAPPSTISLSPSLVAAFSTGDKRALAWIGTIRDSGNRPYYYAYKYKQNKPAGTPKECSVVLRAEEQYLIRAEAYAQLGEQAKALQDINVIRQRAGIPLYTTLDKQLILDEISKEKKLEFFTEYGLRFFDLKRTGRIQAVMVDAKPNWTSKFQNFPIPESELLLNPKLGPQNEGF